MTTYYLTNINENKQSADLTHLKNRGVNSIDSIEKILAAEFYTLNAKKCKNKMKMETLVFKSTDEQYSEFKLISEQYKEEFQTITKQFLTETPREFLRLNNFEVVEQ